MTRPYLDDDLTIALFGGQSIPEILRQLRAWTETKTYKDFVTSHNIEPGDWLTAFKLAVIVRQPTPVSHQQATPPPPVSALPSFEIDISL